MAIYDLPDRELTVCQGVERSGDFPLYGWSTFPYPLCVMDRSVSVETLLAEGVSQLSLGNALVQLFRLRPSCLSVSGRLRGCRHDGGELGRAHPWLGSSNLPLGAASSVAPRALAGVGPRTEFRASEQDGYWQLCAVLDSRGEAELPLEFQRMRRRIGVGSRSDVPLSPGFPPTDWPSSLCIFRLRGAQAATQHQPQGRPPPPSSGTTKRFKYWSTEVM